MPPRSVERARAVALAQHYRQVERLGIREIAHRLDRTPATIRGYLHDPDGSRARAFKQRHRGVCPRCGAATSPGVAAGGGQRLCRSCKGLAERQWTRELIIDAMRAWACRYGQPPTSTDLSRSYANRHGGQRLARLQAGWEGGAYPPLSVTQYHFGSFKQAKLAAFPSIDEMHDHQRPAG